MGRANYHQLFIDCFHSLQLLSLWVGVCMCASGHLGQGVVGGDFNWSSAAGAPSGESLAVKCLRATEHTLVLLSSDGRLNMQHPD